MTTGQIVALTTSILINLGLGAFIVVNLSINKAGRK